MRKIPANQRGVTLISLMIALLIGSFLLAGLFQLWFRTRQTFSAQGQLALLQDNERMALTIMANTIQTGGYYPLYLNYIAPFPATPYSQTVSLPVSGVYATQGQAIYGFSTTTGTTTSDTLDVRFVADKNTLDCQGQSYAGGTYAVGSVVNNTYSVANGNLQCSVNGNTAVTIVSGVASLSMLYSVAIPSTTPQAYQYMTAATVTTDNDWSNVQSAEIFLTFNNPLYGQAGQSQYIPQVSRVVALTQTAL